jgi:hypothetical protein
MLATAAKGALLEDGVDLRPACHKRLQLAAFAAQFRLTDAPAPG